MPNLRRILTGIAGTLGSVVLDRIDTTFSIMAGAATATYMVLMIILKYRELRARRQADPPAPPHEQKAA